MPGWIGPWDLLIILFIVLLVFGGKRIPEIGRSLGKGMREFKHSVTGKDEHEPVELQTASAQTDAAPPAARPKARRRKSASTSG
jgi:sec-independent protein translocase protein TatA